MPDLYSPSEYFIAVQRQALTQVILSFMIRAGRPVRWRNTRSEEIPFVQVRACLGQPASTDCGLEFWSMVWDAEQVTLRYSGAYRNLALFQV